MYNVQSPIYRYLSLIKILNKMSEKWCQFLSLKSWIANRNLDRNKKDKLKPFVGIRYEQKTTKAINTIFCSCSYFFFFLSIHSFERRWYFSIILHMEFKRFYSIIRWNGKWCHLQMKIVHMKAISSLKKKKKTVLILIALVSIFICWKWMS